MKSKLSEIQSMLVSMKAKLCKIRLMLSVGTGFRIEYAKDTQFKQRIAHGMLVFSVTTGLLKIEPGMVVAFYGMDK
ncbi:hypothetical protein GCM10027286_18040 [Virgibacillus ainsalahensis]